MKLCGCKETCFETGDMWGHLSGVMCKYLGESTNSSICVKDDTMVDTYFNRNEYQKKLIVQRNLKLQKINER
jgi:hypothetical protein